MSILLLNFAVLALKTEIALAASLVTIMVMRYRKLINRLPSHRQAPVLLGFFLTFRILPFIGVYILLGEQPRSDVPVFYEAALHALHGDLVYADFWTPYSPLFPYVTALPLVFWNNAKAIVLLMILVEGLTIGLTWRAYRSEVPDIFLRMLLYLTLCGPIVLCVIGGQEDIWMWLFVVLTALVWQKTRDSLWIGVVMALGLIFTKALLVLFAVPLLLLVDKPVRYVAGLALTGLPALVILLLLVGTRFMTPMSIAELPFAPNLWTVLSPLIGDFRPYSKPLIWGGVALTVGVTCLAALALKHRATFPKALPILWTLCFCFMMFIHKNSFSNYAFIFLMPMLVSVINLKSFRQILALLIFNALVVVQPTFWWGLGTPFYTDWSALGAFNYLVEYAMELIIIGCLLYFLTHLYRGIWQGQRRPSGNTVRFPMIP
ncbi:hypothetical protein [Larkinella soli]|uniref:hypothetical protein n=1 Tax=Larkinella soli TaxID=1770527 RepID=UPI000FFC489C|nr:hypothetical protein [Larkinella soli]